MDRLWVRMDRGPTFEPLPCEPLGQNMLCGVWSFHHIGNLYIGHYSSFFLLLRG